MLPAPLLLVALPDGPSSRVVPRYLGAKDEVWVREALDVFDAYVGRSVGERAATLPDQVRALARDHGAPARAADGVVHVVMRRFKAEVRFAKLSGQQRPHSTIRQRTDQLISTPGVGHPHLDSIT